MGEMRVQLQASRKGNTPHTHSIPVIDTHPNGVTVRALRDCLLDLYNTTKQNARWYPLVNLKDEYILAIVAISERLSKYPPAGGSNERNKTTIEHKHWSYHGVEYRIDVESMGGVNLMDVSRTPKKKRRR